MSNLIRILVDEPESCTQLSRDEMIYFKRLLPTLIDCVVFSVFNELFLADVNKPIDIDRVARLLSANILVNNSIQGLIPGGSSESLLTRPLEELVTYIIPALTKLGRFSLLTDVLVKGEQIEILIQNNH